MQQWSTLRSWLSNVSISGKHPLGSRLEMSQLTEVFSSFSSKLMKRRAAAKDLTTNSVSHKLPSLSFLPNAECEPSSWRQVNSRWYPTHSQSDELKILDHHDEAPNLVTSFHEIQQFVLDSAVQLFRCWQIANDVNSLRKLWRTSAKNVYDLATRHGIETSAGRGSGTLVSFSRRTRSPHSFAYIWSEFST